MNPIDLLKLANQADKEGRFAIADKLTLRATRVAAGLPAAEILQAGERGALHGLERAGTEAADHAAAEALLRSGPGHRANTGNIASQVNTQGGIHSSPVTMTEKVGQELEQEVKLVGPREKNVRKINIDGRDIVLKDQSVEYLESLLPRLDPKQKKSVEYIISLKKRGNPFKQKAELKAEQSGATGADNVKMEAPTSTSTGGIQQSGSPFTAGPRSKVFNVSEGSTLNMGNSTAAMLGGMGIVGALGALGMYLGRDGLVRDRNDVVVAPQNIPVDVAKRLPRYQTMTRREEAGQLGGQRALVAQNFVDANASNPRLKNQRDWYNYALQTSGGDKNFANNVISYVKASPEISSSVGGGPNI